jgi:hypothetical protein
MPARRRARLPVLIAIAVAAWIAMPATPAWIPQAQAQVRRCTTADGGTVFTDRLCSEVDATEQVQRAEAGTPLRPYRGGCARTLQDLIHEVTSAIDARDGNRLATTYHWAGLSTRTGYSVIEQLDRIAQRPLVDITALRPATQVVVVERPGISAPVFDEDYHAQTARNRRPTALRIDQMLADGITPSRTIFGLRRHMDCWWITL